VPVRIWATVCAAIVVFLAGCGGGSKDKSASTADPAGAPTSGGTSKAKLAPLKLRFQAGGTLPMPMQLPAAAPLASDGALVMGGLDQADSSSSAIVRVSGTHARQAGSLPTALHDAAAATVGSRTLFMGGGNGGSSSSAIDLVSPGGVTTRIGALPVAASDVSAAAVGGSIYVVGGYDGQNPLDTIVRVDPSSGNAHVVAHLPYAVRYAAVTAVGHQIVIAGGSVGTSATDAVLRFDPATRKVKRIGHLPAGTTHAAAAAAGGTAFVLGGRGGNLNTQRSTVYGVDPATGRVHRAGHLPAALSDLSAVSLPDRVLVFGGRDAQGQVSDRIWAGLPYRSGNRQPRVARDPKASASGLQTGVIPPPASASNVYAADRPGDLSPVVRHARAYVYVPNSRSNTVDVISQRSGRIVRSFAVGALPQHVTPSWDLKTLYVTNDLGNSLTPINPDTGRPARPIPVTDPYNMYFTADGRYAIVVEEAHRVLAFRDAQTMKLHHALSVPTCPGVDHMDFTADGRTALVSCEFSGRMIVVDLMHERVLKTIALSPLAMPQDVKLSPDGRTFYVADMASNGVWLVNAKTMKTIRFMHTGAGAHGLYPSRDAKTLYVSNRGEGSISLIDFRTRRVRDKWHIPGGGSPDMGGVSADGRVLWLSGRYSAEVYAISTRTGKLLHRISVGLGPHGMCVWPQPGRYSIGHTGILR
jgi:DNA-binding beta-propeller fold protein YncE